MYCVVINITWYNMAVIGTLVLFSGIVFVIFVLGIHNFLISNEENGCDMTYMIEYPQFVVSFLVIYAN